MNSFVKSAGIVVTGAGRGIGRAIAYRFAEEGARVVVCDRHSDRASEVAAEIGGIPLTADATTNIVPAARSLLGSDVDVFCANAGFVGTGGPEREDAVWNEAWETNLMAHVRAARDLLPRWLERGDGCFISVVSAAGLLTMMGAGPYAVTKHAALAFAEWMSATYRHRGIRVHAVCPRGVETETRRLAATEITLSSVAITPDDVAEIVLDHMRADRFLVLPHPEVIEHAQEKIGSYERWLAQLNEWQKSRESD